MQRRGDRSVRWHQAARILGPAIALLLVFQLIRLQPKLIELGFTRGLGRLAERTLTTVFGWIPFSVIELTILALVATALTLAIRGVLAVIRRQRSLRNLAERGLAQLLVVGSLTLVLFELTWGLNYGRAPMMQRMGWTEPDPSHPTATTELVLLAGDLVELTNEAYLEIHHTEDAGTMTAAPSRAALDEGVEAGWLAAIDVLGLTDDLRSRRPPAKPLLSSPLMSKLGLSGVYSPYTSEANYNAQTPGWQLPHTVAHEKAHQRSFASEDEANFVGYAVCIHSPDPTVRYSGLLFAQRRLLFSLLAVDPHVAYQLILQRLPGVQRDVSEARAFWAGQDGQLRDISSTVNDAYLRANRVRGGIRSYSLSTELILAWARSRGLDAGPRPLTGSSHDG